MPEQNVTQPITDIAVIRSRNRSDQAIRCAIDNTVERLRVFAAVWASGTMDDTELLDHATRIVKANLALTRTR